MYAIYGAKATGKTPFLEQYAPDDWTPSDGKPDIVAMILPNNIDEIIRRYDKSANIQLATVKTYNSYDDMIADRDKIVKQNRKIQQNGLISG